MDILVLINSYIKYVYYLLGLILLICFIVLIKNTKHLNKTIEGLNTSKDNIIKDVEEIKEKTNKVQYTLEHSVPLFAFLFFGFVVIKAAIKDCRNNKYSKRNFIKSTLNQYRKIARKNRFKRTRNYSTKFIKEIIKLA